MKQPILVLILCLISLQNYAQKIIGSYNAKTNIFETENTDYWIDYFDGNVGRISQNGLFGLIDTNGNIICPIKYEEIYPFQQECAIVYRKGKYGLLDTLGNVICPLKFDYINLFTYKQTVVKLKGQCGIIDHRGCEILQPQIDDIRPFTTSSVTCFSHRNKKNKQFRHGLINHKGAFIMDSSEAFTIHPFQDGMAVYQSRKNQEICLVDSLGNFISIDLSYETLVDNLNRISRRANGVGLLKFTNGLAPFADKQNERYCTYGFLNKKGKVVIAPLFDLLQPFRGQLTVATINKAWCVIDKLGNIIRRDTCNHISLIKDKWVLISKLGGSGVLSLKGDTIIPFKYQMLRHLLDDLFFARAVYIDSTSKIDSQYVIAPSIYPPSGYAINLSPPRGGVINTSLDTIIPFVHSSIDYMIHQRDTQLIATTDTYFVYIPDLTIRSSMEVYDRRIISGYYTTYQMGGLLLDNREQYTYEKQSFYYVPYYLDGKIPFYDKKNTFYYKERRRGYLINKKFPSPKYKIQSSINGLVLIKKKKEYAVVDLRGKILKPFSRGYPGYNYSVFNL